MWFIEVLVFFGVVGIIGGVANADDQRPLVWGGIALAVCLLSLLIPIPYVRLAIAFIVCFVAMFVYKIVMDRR
jgi:hypothetical protein